ncbi:hemagglutinin repeat-containing protein, partial [uncultured Fusobacterium sp.]|uniref:hemagglutinin repeat-containing protein n=1 Tax=uncultured Fusobacterium sp. TaxID=159267 RepID=UPI00261BC580
MIKRILFFFLSIYSLTFSIDEIDIEKRREEQQNFDKLIKSQIFERKEPGIENEGKDIILDINSIKLEGNTVFEDFQIESILRKYTGRNKNIYELINILENKYIERGYITTKIGLNIEESDLESGKISLFVLEGKIDKVFYDGKENKFKTFITFPQRENNLLNIRDLDQGIDNLGDNSKLDIKASDKNEYSDIYIKRDNKSIGFGINYNDLGQFETSRHRIRYFFNTHNIFGLNESLDFSYQQKLQRQYKERDAKNFSFSLNIPFKYWSFSYSYDSSEYLRTINALGRKYKATGNTETQTFGLRKMLHRNEDHKIEIGARKNLIIGNLEAVDKKVRDGKKDYVSDEKRTNVESNLNAKDISLTSLGDIGISGSNIVATNKASIQAKGDISIVAGKDSISHKEKHSKSKGFGRSESSTDMKYNEKLVPTQIIGKDVDIVSEKNITVVGSNLLAENKLNIGAKEDINIISGKQGSSEVHQKTKTGFMKLSGRMSLEDNLKYENISSNIQAGKEVNLVSEKNINILASNISSKENINMLAKKNVNILAGDNIEENYKKETKYRTSLFADFKGLNFEVGAKVKGSQTKEGIHKTTVASSNINTGKDLYIKSGNDTTIQAGNFSSENTYVTSDGKINIISKDSTISTEFSNKEIEVKISAGVRLNGVKETLKSSYQVVKGLKHLPDTIGIAKDLLKGQDLNEALVGKEKAIEEANLVANGPKTGEVGAGIYAGAKFSFTKGNSKITDSVGSNIVSTDTVSLKSKDDIKMQDININAKNILIDSDKNISIEAGKTTSTSKMSSISGDGEINLVTGQFNIGAGVSKDTSESVIYKNSKIIGENIKVKGQDFSIKGGNIIGN